MLYPFSKSTHVDLSVSGLSDTVIETMDILIRNLAETVALKLDVLLRCCESLIPKQI